MEHALQWVFFKFDLICCVALGSGKYGSVWYTDALVVRYGALVYWCTGVLVVRYILSSLVYWCTGAEIWCRLVYWW